MQRWTICASLAPAFSPPRLLPAACVPNYPLRRSVAPQASPASQPRHGRNVPEPAAVSWPHSGSRNVPLRHPNPPRSSLMHPRTPCWVHTEFTHFLFRSGNQLWCWSRSRSNSGSLRHMISSLLCKKFRLILLARTVNSAETEVKTWKIGSSLRRIPRKPWPDCTSSPSRKSMPRARLKRHHGEGIRLGKNHRHEVLRRGRSNRIRRRRISALRLGRDPDGALTECLRNLRKFEYEGPDLPASASPTCDPPR